MSDSSYGSVMVEGVVYIDEREIAKRDAEIESLRLQVKMIPLPEYRDDPRLHEVIEEQKAEIERLRERLQEAAKLNLELMDIRRNNEAEIERLRGELAVEKGWISQYRDSYCKQVVEIERLHSTIATWERACASYVEALAARDAENKALKSLLEKE